MRERLNFGKRFRRYIPINFDQTNGIATGLFTAKAEIGDVDACLAECRTKRADETRLILVRDIEHMAAKRAFHVHALDLDDARKTTGEHRTGNRTLLPLRLHDEADIGFVSALLLATNFRHLDVALLGDDRGGHHVDV